MVNTNNIISFDTFLLKQFQNEKMHTNKLNNARQKHDNTFNLIHMNIRSIKKHITELQCFISEISNKIHIIALSESWLSQHLDLKYIFLNNYQLINTVNNQKQNDGVINFIRNDCSFSYKEIRFTEANCLITNITSDNSTYCVISVYRSPNGNANIFLEQLQVILYNITTENKNINIIFCGDINIDLLNNNRLANNYLDLMTSYGFISYVNSPTRVWEGSETCIDHIFIKKIDKYYIDNAIILETSITDHFPIFIQIMPYIIKKSIEITDNLRNTRKFFNKNNFKSLINKETWNNTPTTASINSNLESYTKKIQDIIQKCNVYTNYSNTVPIKPWITKSILNSIKTRDLLHSQSRKKPYDLALKEKFKKYRNNLNNILNKEKFNFYGNKIKQCNRDPKKIWKTINEATKGPNYNNKNNNLQINIENNIYSNKTHPEKIANYFNNYFAKITTKNLNELNEPTYDNIDETVSHQSLYIRKTNLIEIKNIVLSLKGGTAPGHDNITTEMVKMFDDEALKPLVNIINDIIYNGVIPNSFKLSIITPIHKKGNKTNVENYRPISLLTTFSKIFERVVKLRLANYLEENMLLPPTQFGFRKGFNTEDAITSLTQTILHSIDTKKKNNWNIHGSEQSF